MIDYRVERINRLSSVKSELKNHPPKAFRVGDSTLMLCSLKSKVEYMAKHMK